jgi:4-hydroxyphenylpyruvate dioxygenase
MGDDLCFWAGTTLPLGLEARVAAAAAGGFAAVSVYPTDCLERGGGEVRALVETAGLRVAALDPYTRWVPRWAPPADMPRAFLALVGAEEEQFLDDAVAVGAPCVTALEAFGDRFAVDDLAEGLAGFCDRAAARGLRVHLEFTPFGGVPDLATAWAVIERAGRPNLGLVLDTWHYLRGRPDDALLDAIPGERILAVHVSDGPATSGLALVDETMRDRRLPGEGDWPLVDLLALLVRKPGLGQIGVEVLSEELWRLAPDEIGRRCGDALRGTLASAAPLGPAAEPPG